MIELVNDYIEEKNKVAIMKSDLIEGKVIVEHPNDIFNKNDVKIVNEKLKLGEKLQIGFWDYLVIQREDLYLISLNKSNPDIFTISLVKEDYKDLALAVKDITKRIFKVVDGRIPKGQSKLKSFI
jgi:hypothetical protein